MSGGRILQRALQRAESAAHGDTNVLERQFAIQTSFGEDLEPMGVENTFESHRGSGAKGEAFSLLGQAGSRLRSLFAQWLPIRA